MKRLLALMIFLSSAGACSDEPAGGSAGSATEDFASRWCRIQSRCCAKADLQFCYKNTVKNAVADPDACIAALEAAGDRICLDFYTPPSACRAPGSAVGTAAPGEACTYECAPSTDGDVECVKGKCQVRALGGVGATGCVGDYDGEYYSVFDPPADARIVVCDLRGGAYCDRSTCAARRSVGAACEEGWIYQCAEGAYCSAYEKRCTRLQPKGAKCTQDIECVDGTYCDGTCRERKLAWVACSSDRECKSYRCSGECVPGGFAGGQVCTFD